MDTARASIEKVWGVPPLLVREGGTMPISSFLSRQLKAPAVHIPLGQSSDSGHLPNERIRITNLVNGKVILSNITYNIDSMHPARMCLRTYCVSWASRRMRCTRMRRTIETNNK